MLINTIYNTIYMAYLFFKIIQSALLGYCTLLEEWSLSFRFLNDALMTRSLNVPSQYAYCNLRLVRLTMALGARVPVITFVIAQ